MFRLHTRLHQLSWGYQFSALSALKWLERKHTGTQQDEDKRWLCIKLHAPPLGYKFLPRSGEQCWWWCWGNEVTAARWSFQHPGSIYILLDLHTGSVHSEQLSSKVSLASGAQSHRCSKAPGQDVWRLSWRLSEMLVLSKRSRTVCSGFVSPALKTAALFTGQQAPSKTILRQAWPQTYFVAE